MDAVCVTWLISFLKYGVPHHFWIAAWELCSGQTAMELLFRLKGFGNAILLHLFYQCALRVSIHGKAGLPGAHREG